MEHTNKYKLKTYAMWHNLDAILTKEYKKSKGVSDVSVTELKDSPLVSVLKRRYSSEVIKDITDTIVTADGSVQHKAWEEAAPEEWLVEHRFFKEVNGWVLSGQADFIIPTENDEDGIMTKCILGDYKNTSIYKLKKSNEELHDFDEQLNILTWLMAEPDWVEDADGNTVEWTPPIVEELLIVGKAKDYSAAKAAQNDFPSIIREISFDVWDTEKAEAYIKERIRLHQEARAYENIEDVPQCTKEEMWAGQDKYAIMKVGGKRSVKNFDTKPEAESFKQTLESEPKNKKFKYFIESRPGTRTRCMLYCDYKEWCPYGTKAEIETKGKAAFKKLADKKLKEQ